jgi:hypothetical protein
MAAPVAARTKLRAPKPKQNDLLIPKERKSRRRKGNSLVGSWNYFTPMPVKGIWSYLTKPLCLHIIVLTLGWAF